MGLSVPRPRRIPTPAPWLVLLVVGLVALAIRLAFLFRAPVFIIGDSENYFWPGYQLARGIGFDLDLRRTPIYPLFISLVVLRIGEDLAALALAQHLLGVLTCLTVAWLGTRLWGAWTGLLAGLLVALSGPLLIAEHYVMAETLFIPFATLTVCWLVLALERPRWWMLLIGGVLIGVAGLTRPVGLVMAVATLLALPLVTKESGGTAPSPDPSPALGVAAGVRSQRRGRGETPGHDSPSPDAGETAQRRGPAFVGRRARDYLDPGKAGAVGKAEGCRRSRYHSGGPHGRVSGVRRAFSKPDCVGWGARLRWAAPLALALIAGVALIWLPWMWRNSLVNHSFSADGNTGQTLVGRAMRHDPGFAYENPNDPDPMRQRAREIMRAGRGRFVSLTRDRLRREFGLSEAEANKLMRDLALEAILRQPDYYLYGTVRNFGILAQGTSERYRDHWNTRRDSGSREEWEALFDIKHLLGPPTPLQERQYPEAEALVNLFQPARLGPTIPLLALVGALGLAWGMGSRRPRPAVAALLALVVIGLLGAAVAMVAPLPRYRYPIEPLIGLLAAGGVATVVGAVISVLSRQLSVISRRSAAARS